MSRIYGSSKHFALFFTGLKSDVTKLAEAKPLTSFFYSFSTKSL